MCGMMAGYLVSADWMDLERELEKWELDNRAATLWWRDDDAVRATDALDRLLDLAAGIPLSLAVIPGRVAAGDAEALAARLARHGAASVLQHGWMHINHAPADAKKAELGAHRPIATILAELASGWQRLAALFGRRALPVLTPPWNRIAPALPPLLRQAGYIGLSADGPRARREPSPGLIQVNTHADLVAWPAGGFVGTALALGRIVGHLQARRAGTADSAEPTGLLTHHLVQDGETAGFIDRLLRVTRHHPAARWIGAAEAFAAP
jgi:hypothetical protein